MGQDNKRKIFLFNTYDSVQYQTIKSYFNLSDVDVYNIISDEFNTLQKRLELKKIDYNKLKGALIPNQDKDRFEICFVFDTNKIEDYGYGQYIFEKLIPILDKESTYSILCGDYVDISQGIDNSQLWLKQVMEEKLNRCNTSEYIHSDQYYLIYFNRLTNNQCLEIANKLLKYSWFVGFIDLSYNSPFKSYISTILVNLCIKCGDKIILSHPSDYSDEENINCCGYSFTENDFNCVSINEESFDSFLSYKIESEFIDENDIGFSFNALIPKFDSFNKLKLNVKDEKWNKYLANKETGKGIILEHIGYEFGDREKFIKEIYKKIQSQYMYNLTKNEYGDLIFDVCVELPTIRGNKRKTTVALKYLPDIGEIQIITVT